MAEATFKDSFLSFEASHPSHIPLFCDVCNDQVKVAYPCKFVFHDKREIPLNICPDCMENGELIIDLRRKRMISYAHKALRFREKCEGEKEWQETG